MNTHNLVIFDTRQYGTEIWSSGIERVAFKIANPDKTLQGIGAHKGPFQHGVPAVVI